MNPSVHIETERLWLRDWSDADAEPFAAMNADRCVMEFFPALLESKQSDEFMARIRSSLARDGFGLYAVVRDHAFKALGFDALVSFTSQQNHRSRRVMEKIGMTRDPADDFIHPGLPSGHELAPHVLYRILSSAISN